MAQSPLILDSPIWDTVVVLKAGPANGTINIFSRPVGQNDEAGTAKTNVQTSLTDTGKLPEPESFDVHYLQCIYMQSAANPLGVPEADQLQIENQSYVTFLNAGLQIKAFQCTKTILASGAGFTYSSAGAAAQPGYPAPSAVYKLDHPILLGINETFNIQWSFGTIALSNNATVRWVLRGPHYMVDVMAPQNPELPVSATNPLVSTRRSR